MPCYDHQAAAEAKELKGRCDKLARLLCGACRWAEAQRIDGLLFAAVPELGKWWVEHKGLDALRPGE